MTATLAIPRVAPGSVVRLAPEQVQDAARVDALVDEAFGPGRFAKTAERVRETAVQRLDLSICAWSGDTLVGAVRLWSVRIGGEPAVFLGPIEVRREHRRQGLAAALVERACDAARMAGERTVLLVGAAAIFLPMGFQAVPEGRVTLPGPIDPRRLFWRDLAGGGITDAGGLVGGSSAFAR